MPFGGSHLVAAAEDRKPWDQSPPDHRYGAVLLRPGATDPLIRLILMHLYLGLDDSLGAYTRRSPTYPLICPACGGAEMTHQPPPGTRETGHPGELLWRDIGLLGHRIAGTPGAAREAFARSLRIGATLPDSPIKSWNRLAIEAHAATPWGQAAPEGAFWPTRSGQATWNCAKSATKPTIY